MPHRGRKNTMGRIRRIEAQGRGQIDCPAEQYVPGIHAYEISSNGKTARIRGETTNRVHHMLSQQEKYFFLLLDYDPTVTDIREQVLLPLDQTLLIAAKKKIRHPYADNLPARMSTDFYYVADGHPYAVAIKTSEDLEKTRVQEKLSIEEEYWTSHNVPWRVVTEKDIPLQLVVNTVWLHGGEKIEVLIPDEDYRRNLEDTFIELYGDITITFSEIVSVIEKECGLRMGTMMQMFKSLVLQGRIQLGLTQRINLVDPRMVTKFVFAD